ncbi:MAG: MFS transporter [Rhodocyclaceae bacterium]|nr:MFS transporter [Rhodocyclaceae bacterium]MCA3091298.1 MFS transporter [Rhodocyclaceae bacterium]MCA3095435.1 MFS transporter [Rhodocyclaceae bacterium]MCA3099985.1 MFS transporter [Rhodocyclaceae bacterium]MCA3103209.1 MFS transporter [Rhodocyclaceae bacterium]
MSADAPRVGVTTAVGVAFAVQAGVALVIFAPPVLAPAATRTMGLDPSTVGVFTSLVYLFAAIAAVSSARPVAALGALRASQICLLLCAAGIALVATASLPLVVLGAMLLGLGYGPVTPSSAIILVSTLPARFRSLGFSVKQTGVPVGAGVCGLAIPALVAAFDWQVAAFVLAAAVVAGAVLCQPLQRDFDEGVRGSGPSASTSPLGSLALVWRLPRLRELAIGSFVFAGIQMCVVTYLVVFLTETGLGLGQAGLAMTCAMIGGLVGRIGWGWVADNLLAPRRTLALVSLLMGMTSLGLACVQPSWPLAAVIAMSAAAGLSSIAWNGVYLAEVAHRAPPGMATAATGGTMFCTYAGVMVWPTVFYVAHAATGSYVASFVLVGLLGLAGAALFVRPSPD